MNITVKNIDYTDEQRMIKELKELGKDEIINYIKALKRVIEGQKETNALAIKQIMELSKEKTV
jgi:hypothetical protein